MAIKKNLGGTSFSRNLHSVMLIVVFILILVLQLQSTNQIMSKTMAFLHVKPISVNTNDIPSVTEVEVSPACKPHFQLTTPLIGRTNTSKFKRLYFYHVRKAGGTSLSTYFKRVAKHHGLQYVHTEYGMAEEPGTNSVPTLYVTHMRDPVSVIVLYLCKNICIAASYLMFIYISSFYFYIGC